MHGFLLIGNNTQLLKTRVNELANSLKAKVLPQTLLKIEDVRNLNNLTTLSLNEKTIIFIEDIEKATTEALNAFLKNLEEPQENLYFALTASSVKKVLPTIVSRCQVIKLQNEEKSGVDIQAARDFLKESVGKKLLFIEKFRDRENAITFVESIIYYLHSLLHSNELPDNSVGKNIEVANKTLKNLKANGNITLQLTFFVSNLV